MADKQPRIKIKTGIQEQLSKINSNANDTSGQTQKTPVDNGPKRRLVYNADGSLKGVEEVSSSGETFPAYNPNPSMKKEGELPIMGMGDVKAVEQRDAQTDYNVPMTLKPGVFEVKPNNTPADETKREMFNYEKLNQFPAVKKAFRDQRIIPLPKYRDANGDVKLEDYTPYYQNLENNIRTEALNNLNKLDIPVINSLSDEAKLQYAGATYMNNPFVAGLSAILTPVIASDNVVRGALNKYFGAKYDMIPYPNYKGEQKSDELMNFGASMIANLIPIGAATKGAGYVLRGIENPYTREILSTAIGFTAAEQPTLLDQLQQGKITPEDYARETAKSLGTGAVFGVSGPLFKGNFKYSLPYNAIAPSLVPVLVDLATGKDVNYEELAQNMVMNPLLDIGFNWARIGKSKLSEKLRSMKNPYKDTKIDLIFNPKTGKYEQVVTVDKEMFDANGEPYTGVEKQVLQEIQGLLPYRDAKTNFEVGPNGETTNLKNKSGEMLMKSYSELSPEELNKSQGNLEKPFKVNNEIQQPEVQSPQWSTERNRSEFPPVPETSLEKSINGVIASSDPKGVMELKTEEARLDNEFKAKLNKEPIQEITNPGLLKSQSSAIRNRTAYLNEAIREHNKQFEQSNPDAVIQNDLLTEQNKYLDGKISEVKAQLEGAKNNAEVSRLNELLGKYEERKKSLNNIKANGKTNEAATERNTGQQENINRQERQTVTAGEQKGNEKVSQGSEPVSKVEPPPAENVVGQETNNGGEKSKLLKPEKPVYEYTRYEYVNENPEGITNKKSGAPVENLLMDRHEREVRKALMEGKNVPAEVLQEYPQIVEQAKSKKELENIINGWDLKVDNAKKNIKGRGNNINIGVDPSVIKDFAIVGADLIKKGASRLYNFGQELRNKYGPSVTPFIRKIWEESKKVWNELSYKYKNLQEYITEKDVKIAGFFGDKAGINYKLKNDETFGAYAKRIISETGQKSMDLGELRKRYNIEKERLNVVSENINNGGTTPNPSLSKEGDVRSEAMNGGKEQSKFSQSAKDYGNNIDADIERWQKNEKDRKKARELVKNAIKELPAIEEKLVDGGMNKYDVAEKLSSEITKKIFATPEYKDMDVQGRERVRKAIKNYFDSNLKDPNQIANVLFEPKARIVTAPKKILRNAIYQATTVISKYGAPGKEFVKRIKKMADDERIYLGKASEILFDMNKNLSRAEYQNLKDIRTAKRNAQTYIEPLQRGNTAVRGLDMKSGQRQLEKESKIPKPINEKVAEYDRQLEEFYNYMAKEFQGRDMMTKNPFTGEVYFFNPRNQYEPRILKDDVDLLAAEYKMTKDGDYLTDENGVKIPQKNKARERVLEYLVQTGQARNAGEASFMLDNFIAGNRLFKAGNVEYARTIDLPPEMYKDDVSEVLIQYTKAAAKRISLIDAFGKEKGIAETLFNEMRELGHDDQFARRLLMWETGDYTSETKKQFDWVNVIKGVQTVAKFTHWTSITNMFQGFLGTTTRGNIRAGVEGLVKSFTKDGKKNAYKSGVLADNIESLLMTDIGGGKEFTNKFLKYIGFTAGDKINRIISTAGADTFYNDMLSRIKSNSVFKRRAIREFEKVGINPNEVIKNGGFTEAQRDYLRRTFAGDAQFSTRPQDVPNAWNSPTGKLITQWKPFGYKMTQLIRDNVLKEARNGNLFPLATMLIAYGASGEVLNSAKDYVRSWLNFDPKQMGKDYVPPGEKGLIYKLKAGDVPGALLRLVDDYASLGSLGMFVDILRSFGYGKGDDITTVMGPWSGDVKNIAKIIAPTGKLIRGGGVDNWGKETASAAYDFVMGITPLSGLTRTVGLNKYLKDVIFGIDEKVKDDFYKTLNNDERREMNRINDAMKERSKIKDKNGKEYQDKYKEVYYLQKNSAVWKRYEKFAEQRKQKADEEADK